VDDGGNSQSRPRQFVCISLKGIKTMPHAHDAQAMSLVRGILCDLEELVENHKWSLDAVALEQWRREPWAGARVVICCSLPPQPDDRYTFIVTPFAGELSWLFDYLKEIFSSRLDFANKYEFYGRLAQAAIQYTESRQSCVANPADLCFAVIREARKMLEEIVAGGIKDRNMVIVRGIEVQLHPLGWGQGVGMAIYCQDAHSPVDLEGVSFVHRGLSYRFGKLIQRSSDGGDETRMLTYHETNAAQ
jgi:hypothetical protein